ncbi:MAG: tetratricopeptide repeat protein, partial [Pseudomonadota bacterium]
QSTANLDETLSKARASLAEGGRKKAVRLLEPFAGQLETSGDLAALFAEACLAVGRVEDAKKALSSVPESWGGWQRAVLEAQVLTANGQAKDAAAILEPLSEAERERTSIWRALAEAQAALNDWPEALFAAKRWSSLAPTSGEPFRLIADIHRATGNVEQADSAYRAAMDAEYGGQEFLMDYAEFLLEQKRFDEARNCLKSTIPETRWQQERLQNLLLFAG